MNSSTNSLLNLWYAEKENYQTQDIGSGMQKFVKKVFLSPEIFDLKEGKLSTKDENRENEFLEEARKHGRRADIIVFINNEIIIPVEIERLGNIEKGVTQLFSISDRLEQKIRWLLICNSVGVGKMLVLSTLDIFILKISQLY